ncbi:MAG: cytochrome c oxidase subunit II [Spongiibacteraceae bacterium]|jgi:cytochrome c oxidase subunit 2|nr:cytochrome c oxidase subunit II [Spongiibacteraceae bacterium]
MYQKAMRLYRLALGPVLLLLSSIGSSAWAQGPTEWRHPNQVNMPVGVTEVSAQIHSIHMTVFWICVAIGVAVFSTMFYSILVHRKSRGYKPSHFHESTKLEIAWTIVPFIILIVMAVPATSTIIAIYDTEDADLDILVTGYQWKWKYEYIDPAGENISFFSSMSTTPEEIAGTAPKGENYLIEVDEPVVIPVNKKVRFLLTANDVIHAWWVPEFGIKKDAIPGFINEAWARPLKTGFYRGQCAELCGRDHGFMPVVVSVVEQEEYDSWLTAKKEEAAQIKELMAKHFTLPELVQQGQQIYNRVCVACHGPNGEGGIGNALAKSAIVTGALDETLDTVVHGVPGTAMQAFGGQLNDVELAAVTTYIRNSFGNNMGDMTQPVDVFNFKKGQ